MANIYMCVYVRGTSYVTYLLRIYPAQIPAKCFVATAHIRDVFSAFPQPKMVWCCARPAVAQRGGSCARHGLAASQKKGKATHVTYTPMTPPYTCSPWQRLLSFAFFSGAPTLNFDSPFSSLHFQVLDPPCPALMRGSTVA